MLSYGQLLFYSLGRTKEGKDLFQKSLSIFKASLGFFSFLLIELFDIWFYFKTLGPDHPKTISVSKLIDEAN